MHMRSEVMFIKPYTASSSHKIRVPAIGKIPTFADWFSSTLCKNIFSRNW